MRLVRPVLTSALALSSLRSLYASVRRALGRRATVRTASTLDDTTQFTTGKGRRRPCFGRSSVAPASPLVSRSSPLAWR